MAGELLFLAALFLSIAAAAFFAIWGLWAAGRRLQRWWREPGVKGEPGPLGTTYERRSR
jgi:hypothetical protein